MRPVVGGLKFFYSVTLLVKRSGTNKYRPMKLSAREFLRRYLQHVLPSGFQKVRHYGFLSPGCRVPLLLVRWLVAIANDRRVEFCRSEPPATTPRPPLSCPDCGGPLVCREIILASGIVIHPRGPPEESRRSYSSGGIAC